LRLAHRDNLRSCDKVIPGLPRYFIRDAGVRPHLIENYAPLNKKTCAATATKAAGLLTLTIAREELGNAASLEANLVHEGKHVTIQAAVLSSLSTKSPKKYQNETRTNDEIRATSAAARYLLKKGGAHATYGTSINILNPSGKSLNNQFIKQKSQLTGTVQDYLTGAGVSW